MAGYGLLRLTPRQLQALRNPAASASSSEQNQRLGLVVPA
jgi:hypothetical protein